MNIPLYPDSRPLHFSDKPLLDKVFAELQPTVSELTFANLYLFRNAHDYHLSLIGNSIVVLGHGYDHSRYFLPPLGGDVTTALSVLFSDNLPLYGADELFLHKYLAITGLNCSEDRDSFDYLYLREELATLPGSRFHKKKNRIHYYAVRHSFAIELYSQQHVQGCLKLLDIWAQAVRDDNNRSLALEVAATAEALSRAPDVGLEGVVVLTDNSVAAFALGEHLNNETAVCHFEKADPFHEGLSQLINREFAARLFTDCRFLNREQDLGEAGLRNAKLSYHPTTLIKKYRAQPVR